MDFKNLSKSSINNVKQSCSSTQNGETTSSNNSADKVTGDYQSSKSAILNPIHLFSKLLNSCNFFSVIISGVWWNAFGLLIYAPLSISNLAI